MSDSIVIALPFSISRYHSPNHAPHSAPISSGSAVPLSGFGRRFAPRARTAACPVAFGGAPSPPRAPARQRPRPRLCRSQRALAFHPGDDPAWASPDFDDSAWPRLFANKTWEEQGFRNYTGYAWYRQRIVLDSQLASQTDEPWKLVLYVPAVQNAAEVYWNGQLIGSYGKLPPDPVWYDAVWPQGVSIFCPDMRARAVCAGQAGVRSAGDPRVGGPVCSLQQPGGWRPDGDARVGQR